MSTADLPEELLQAVLENLAYNPEFIERENPRFRWKYARSELFSLSVVSRQFRRLCLPFLFAYVEIKGKDLRIFSEQCATFASFIRTLTLNDFDPSCGNHYQRTSLIHLLHFLMNLSQINLENFAVDQQLLAALQHHPVTTVFLGTLGDNSLMKAVEELLPYVSPGDLQKMVVERLYPSIAVQPELSHLLAHGLQVKQLVARKLDILQMDVFRGLQELEILLRTSSYSLSWLPEFALAHPLLKKITFQLTTYLNVSHYILPFIEESCRARIDDTMDVKVFAVTRCTSGSESARASRPFGEWHVTGLILEVRESLDPLLRLVHSLFPQISVLTIAYRSPSETPVDLLMLLSPFSSLRVLNLFNALRHLDFGNQIQWKPAPNTGTEIKAAMIWYTAHMAQKIFSLEAFYVSEPVTLDHNDVVCGWIDAYTLRNNNGREMPGTFDIIPNLRFNNNILSKHTTDGFLV